MTLHRPQDHKELFNYRHARLRNVIECIFGVAKRRFKVLVVAQEYSLATQSQLVSALAVIHNFIRIYDPADTLDDDIENSPEEAPSREECERSNLRERAINNEERDRASERREAIALAMWQDYQRRSQRRRGQRSE